MSYETGPGVQELSTDDHILCLSVWGTRVKALIRKVLCLTVDTFIGVVRKILRRPHPAFGWKRGGSSPCKMELRTVNCPEQTDVVPSHISVALACTVLLVLWTSAHKRLQKNKGCLAYT